MKLAITSLVFLTASVSFACPGFDFSSTYTEVAVPCAKMTPDFSKPVVVNQTDSTGGECRVQEVGTDEFFRVNGSELVWSKNGQSLTVGSLLSAPSCYQTDTGGAYYATWTAVQLNASQ
jgi:hypothetical protein